jgi:cytidylate kinase
VDEKQKGWLDECLEGFLSARTTSVDSYVRHLVETVLALAAQGECVIVGRGAAQFLPPATTLRVRFVGPLEERVRAIAQRYGLGHSEAVRRVEQTDKDRARFGQDHFQKDPNDPLLYDLVLNSSRFTIPDCVGLVVDALHRLQAHIPTRPVYSRVS